MDSGKICEDTMTLLECMADEAFWVTLPKEIRDWFLEGVKSEAFPTESTKALVKEYPDREFLFTLAELRKERRDWYAQGIKAIARELARK